MSKGIKLNKEEYVPAGTFLTDSFSRDRVELATRFSEFSTAYETAFKAQVTKVKSLEQGVVKTEQQKAVTDSLYDASDAVNKELNFVAFYLDRAKLDTKLLSKVKKDLVKRNVEGALYKMEGLTQYITDHKDALIAKGMATTFPATLTAKGADLSLKNASQNKLMNAIDGLYSNNKVEYKLLYSYISTIASAGKIMYDGQTKESEYTVTKLIARMRSGNRGGDSDTPDTPSAG